MAIQKFHSETKSTHFHVFYHTTPAQIFMGPSSGTGMSDIGYIPPARGEIDHGRSVPPTEQIIAAPSLSDLDHIFSWLQDYQGDRDYDNYEALLSNLFLIEQLPDECGEEIDVDRPDEKQSREVVYACYSARPVIEQLLLQRPEIFKKLLETSDPKFKSVLLKSLNQLKLAADEKITFPAGMDLRDANFEGAALGQSEFPADINLTNCNFSNADLSGCVITPEQLDQTVYPKAKLPKGESYMPFWDQDFRNKIMQRVDVIVNYSIQNIQFDDPKSKQIRVFGGMYMAKLLSEPGFNLTSADRKAFISDLNALQKGILSKHRNLKYLIAECVSFCLLGGVGYLVLAGIHKYRTGCFGLFAETRTAKEARIILKELESVQPESTKAERHIAAPAA